MDVFEMEAGENRTFITSVSHLTSGIYFLQIKNKDGKITSVEFIVQNQDNEKNFKVFKIRKF